MKILLPVYRYARGQIQIISKNNFAYAGMIVLIFFALVGIFGPFFMPYDTWESSYKDGKLEALEPPSLRHPFGTTFLARDILCQTISSIRSTLIIGLIAGATSIVIGAAIGLISGYYGGRIDNLLMRFTDVAYGMPFIPLIMVLVAILGRNIWIIAVSLICIVWRSSARVVRAEVMSLRERQFVMFARARGCSDSRIIFKHILPNLLPLLLLYTAINVVWSILSEAAISFLGFGDPDILTLGSMLYELWVSGVFRSAWWWFLPPSVSIVLLISAMIFISQAYEEVTNPKLKER